MDSDTVVDTANRPGERLAVSVAAPPQLETTNPHFITCMPNVVMYAVSEDKLHRFRDSAGAGGEELAAAWGFLGMGVPTWFTLFTSKFDYEAAHAAAWSMAIFGPILACYFFRKAWKVRGNSNSILDEILSSPMRRKHEIDFSPSPAPQLATSQSIVTVIGQVASSVKPPSAAGSSSEQKTATKPAQEKKSRQAGRKSKG